MSSRSLVAEERAEDACFRIRAIPGMAARSFRAATLTK